jgi:flagellar hook protein FlgE
MNTAFYSGLAGLTAYSSALNVVGNNLANINTSGFKSSEISFQDLVTRTFGGVATNGAGNPMQVGLGILPNSISGIFSQGSIQTTSDSTNAAIEGNGFFVVGNNTEERFYTRAGNFFFNDEGDLINPNGQYVLGYTTKDANNDIIASGALSNISFPANTVSAPEQSTFFQVFSNLDVRSDIDYSYSASTTIYDSKGAPHTVSIEFIHQDSAVTAAGNAPADGNDWWSYTVTIPGADVDGGVAGTDFQLAAGTVEFDGTGTLVDIDDGDNNLADIVINMGPFTNGANQMDVTWDIIDDTNVPRITGYPIPSTTSATNTDGYPPGNLTSVVIDQDGIMQGVFDNGQVEELAQLAIASFNNPKGMIRMGRNLYAETNSSGTPAIGAAGTGGRGSVVGSSVESSNVDIATEFTKMLVFERGYQANSKIITASDTLTQTALSLVR